MRDGPKRPRKQWSLFSWWIGMYTPLRLAQNVRRSAMHAEAAQEAAAEAAGELNLLVDATDTFACCGKGWDGSGTGLLSFMLECPVCEEWLHAECIGANTPDKRRELAARENWACGNCGGGESTAGAVERARQRARAEAAERARLQRRDGAVLPASDAEAMLAELSGVGSAERGVGSGERGGVE